MLEKLRSVLSSSDFFAFNQVLRDRWVAEQAHLLPEGTHILDVGAGSCPYRDFFAHCKYKSQDFFSLRGEQLSHGRYGVIDYISDATAIPVPDRSLDAVLCTEMLEHVPEPVKVINEFARILRPNGKLMLTAPLGSGIHQEPYHFYGGFTPYWYERFLGEAGFVNIHVEPNGGFFRHYSQESLRFLYMTRPLALNIPRWITLLGTPLWLFIALPVCVMCAVLCAWLDHYDRECRFTIGYHVTATRDMPESRT